MGRNDLRAISYLFPEMGELNTPVLSFKAPFMEELTKEIENSDRLIEIMDDNRPRYNHYPRVYTLLRQNPEDVVCSNEQDKFVIFV